MSARTLLAETKTPATFECASNPRHAMQPPSPVKERAHSAWTGCFTPWDKTDTQTLLHRRDPHVSTRCPSVLLLLFHDPTKRLSRFPPRVIGTWSNMSTTVPYSTLRTESNAFSHPSRFHSCVRSPSQINSLLRKHHDTERENGLDPSAPPTHES